MSTQPGPAGPERWETPDEREARLAWERGGTSFLPSGRRFADRVVTLVLLIAGAVLTLVIGVVAVVALIAGTAGCDAAAGCSPGGMLGGAALTVGGAFVVGVATVSVSILAWIRKRSSWWIAAIGFVLATCCVVGGGVVWAAAADHARRDGQVTIQPYPLPGT